MGTANGLNYHLLSLSHLPHSFNGLEGRGLRRACGARVFPVVIVLKAISTKEQVGADLGQVLQDLGQVLQDLGKVLQDSPLTAYSNYGSL